MIPEIDFQARSSSDPLDPETLLKTLEYVRALAASPLLPDHIRGRTRQKQFTAFPEDIVIANLLLIADAARTFGVPLLTMAKHSYVVGQKLDFDGQAYAALANKSGFLEQDLKYKVEGKGKEMSVTVSARIRGEDEDRVVDQHITQAKVRENQSAEWNFNPEQMLCYSTARIWVKRHLSKALFGEVYQGEDKTIPAPESKGSLPAPQPRNLPPMPTEHYQQSLLELGRVQYRHQAQRIAEQAGGRNNMTDDERNDILERSRKLWKQLPYSEDDPDRPEVIAAREEAQSVQQSVDDENEEPIVEVGPTGNSQAAERWYRTIQTEVAEDALRTHQKDLETDLWITDSERSDLIKLTELRLDELRQQQEQA